MSNRRFLLWLLATIITAVVATFMFPNATERVNRWLTAFSSGALEIGRLSNEQPEESILIYSAMIEDQLLDSLAAFRTKYPEIHVNYELLSTNELAERVLAERNNPKADVIWGLSATTMQQLDWYDVLTPYAPAGLYRLPQQFRDGATPPAWVGQDIWMNAFCVNIDLLTTAEVPLPKSWMELLDPIYTEMIAFPNPASSGTGYMTLLVYLNLVGERDLWRTLDQLNQNVTQYVDAPEAACEAVVAGEAAIGVSYGLNAVSQRDGNSEIVIVFPEEGSGWDMEAAALVRKYPVEPAAHQLMDFVISDEAMHQYGQYYAITAVPLDYLRSPLGYTSDPLAQLMDKDFLWVGANRNRLTRLWRERYTGETQFILEE